MPVSSAALLERYLEAVLAGDRARCLGLARQALDDGLSIKELYLHVFQASQRRIGELWAENAISVGTEHRATGITQAVIAALYEHIVREDGHGRRLLMGCVGPERHQVGPRMVADFAEMAGYDVTYMGVIASPEALVRAVHEVKPECVGLSATLVVHLPEVALHIEALRADCQGACPRILAGGRAFSFDASAWRRVGADCYASDAEEAIACLNAGGRCDA